MTRSSSSFRLETDKTDGRPGDWTFVHQRKYHFLCEQSTNSDRFINLYVCRYVHLLYNYIEMLARSNLGNRYDIRSSVTIALFHLGCIKKYMVHIQTRINFSITSSVIFFLNFQFFSSATSQLSSEWNYGVVNFPKKSNEKNSSNWKKALYYELV